MGDKEDKYAEFVFQEEEIQEMQAELMAWAEERDITEIELCVILGIIYEFLKEDLGIDSAEPIKITSGEVH